MKYYYYSYSSIANSQITFKLISFGFFHCDRGVALEDSTQPTYIWLLIKDYPYAVDGIAVWSAIQTWAEDYCSIYYANDAAMKSDNELQAW